MGIEYIVFHNKRLASWCRRCSGIRIGHIGWVGSCRLFDEGFNIYWIYLWKFQSIQLLSSYWKQYFDLYWRIVFHSTHLSGSCWRNGSKIIIIFKVAEVEASGYLKRHWPKFEFLDVVLGMMKFIMWWMWWICVTSERWGSARDLSK